MPVFGLGSRRLRFDASRSRPKLTRDRSLVPSGPSSAAEAQGPRNADPSTNSSLTLGPRNGAQEPVPPSSDSARTDMLRSALRRAKSLTPSDLTPRPSWCRLRRRRSLPELGDDLRSAFRPPRPPPFGTKPDADLRRSAHTGLEAVPIIAPWIVPQDTPLEHRPRQK